MRAIVLGCLLPPTDDAEADLAIFEKLMAFDDEGLARRALAANVFSPETLLEAISDLEPERYFGGRGWRRDVTVDEKLELYRRVLATMASHEEKAGLGKRPEEVDQDWLYAPVWECVNRHYAHLGIRVRSLPELVEQIGILRFGHRPRVGDTFCGGGSIPFEAARIGCEAYASDLNPLACMLTWGSAAIIGASSHRRAEITDAQSNLARSVDDHITGLRIEHDAKGNRAKAYLWCLETRCPQSGWMVPLSSSWIVSKSRNAVARLRPDPRHKRFHIDIVSDASDADMRAAEHGTVRDGDMIYTLDGRTYRTPIKTLRGDYRLADGTTGNRLRRWEKADFMPRPDDVFQERLYAIQWITKATLHAGRQSTYFAAPTEADLKRERRVEEIVAENLAHWQAEGLVPDMAIEPGDKTDEPIRTRGWTHWHHLFNPRQLLVAALVHEHILSMPADVQPALSVSLAKMLDWSSKLCRYGI
ncbi:MAG: hypothetical protein JSS45_10515 [Proteobacteria bacterium]|nr:hypothetical protein [Pseudomonadota bacterium]